jgi:hypothetical protein
VCAYRPSCEDARRPRLLRGLQLTPQAVHTAAARLGLDAATHDPLRWPQEELVDWIRWFWKDKAEVALSYWYEVHEGIRESLREF